MGDERELTWAEAQRALIPLMKADNHRNVAYIVREYVLLALALGAGVWSLAAWRGGHLATWAFALAAAALVVVIAALQHRLSGLAHDASHFSLFRDPLANELASDLLLMFPIMGMTQRFRATHLGHHQYINDPERDPDVRRLNDPWPHQFPIAKARFWGRYVLRALWPPTILRYLLGQAKGANLSEGAVAPALKAPYRFRLGRSLRGAYWISVLTVVHATGAWPVFFLFWVLPLLTAYPLLMQLREIAHHSNAPDDGDFTNSRIFRVHPLLSAAIFPYGQDYHLTHHLFAMLPHDRMAQAHAVLMRHPPYRDRVVVCRGFFFRTIGTAGPSVLDVLARRPAPGELVWDGPPRRLA